MRANDRESNNASDHGASATSASVAKVQHLREGA
jgi:hypothetical protein